MASCGQETRTNGGCRIAHRCRRCGSTHLRKNDRTASGQQKFHCKVCNFYGTLDTKDQERAQRRATVEKLQRERLSQCAIAGTVGISRNTVAMILRKSTDPIGETIRPLVERPIPLYLWVRFE
jgi:transposase-like protein